MVSSNQISEVAEEKRQVKSLFKELYPCCNIEAAVDAITYMLRKERKALEYLNRQT